MANQKLSSIQSDFKALQAENTTMKPKALFADSVAASSTSILVRDLAKLLKKNGVDIGEKRLWKWMRDNGYAIKADGRDHNMPTQKSMDLGVMETKENTNISADGESHINKTTLVTGKGQIYFVNKFLEELKKLRGDLP
jgi:anti-repressor protein